jgi:phosphate-selective porin
LSFGQSSESILKILVEKQIISQEEADVLIEENKQKEPDKNVLAKIKTAFNSSDIFRLSGYGQALYQTSDNSKVSNEMKVNRIILFAMGNLNPQVSYMIMYDFGPKAGLHEFYGEYTPVTPFSIRFGQFKIPFTIENPMSPTRWESIYGSLSVNALAGISTDVIGAKAGRDMGLQLSGKLLEKNGFYLLEYAAGLFNGTGFNTSDNNNHKDLIGTLIFQPVKGLKLAGSGYSGKAPYRMSEENEIKNHVRNRWSAGGEFSNSSWYARSEYLYGNDGGIRKDGIYAVCMWKFLPEKLELFGKYDYYNPDKSGRIDKMYEYTGGINYYFGFLSRIQLNYIHSDSGNKINNTVAAQLQLCF